MADRYLLEGSGVDGYQLEDASGVLLLETPATVPDQPLTNTSSLPPRARPRVAIATLCASLAFVPLVAAASADASPAPQGAFVPARTAAVHVQTLTGPVLVPAIVDLVTLDEWHQPTSQPPRRRTSSPPATGAVAPLFVPDVTTPAPPLSWLTGASNTAPPPRPRIGLPTGVLAPEAPAPPAVEPLDWLAPLPQPGPRRSLLPKDGVEPIEAPSPPAVAPLDWLPAPAPAPARRPRLAEATGSTAPLFVPDVTTPAPALSWQGAAQVRPPARPFVVRAETAEPIDVSAPVVAPDVATWAPAGALRATERLRTGPLGTSGAVGPVAPVAVVAPSVASWLPAPVTPPRRRPTPPLAGVTPPRVDVVVVPSVASWAPQPTPPRRRRLGPPDTSRVAPVRTLPAENITIDKWAPVVPARPWPRRRLPRGWDIVYPLDITPGVVPAPTGNLWTDIDQTPGNSPYVTPSTSTGTSLHDAVTAHQGTTPYEPASAGSGASLYDTPTVDDGDDSLW